MLRLFRKFQRDESDWNEQGEDETIPASIGEARRVYAIGDIHGRVDLFISLLNRIAVDIGHRDPIPTELILLGDLVDRGPASRDVVECVMQLAEDRGRIRILKGNHEELFVCAARGDINVTKFFCQIGGRETLFSYGLDPDVYEAMSAEEITEWMLQHIPRAHIDFIDDFDNLIEIGDYVFVHAGIRPGIALDAQKPEDLRWIRKEFLTSKRSFGKVVIHGHTISDEVDLHPNRIGIDTGAYLSDRLTAIGLQGTDRWFLSTAD